MNGSEATSGAKPPIDKSAVSVVRARQAMRLVCAELPQLAGLAGMVRLLPTDSVAVAAVAASGLLCINPDKFATIPLADVAFVLAHELFHLALDTHRRQEGANSHVVNVAHDYIINDMLCEEMGRDVPLGGLVRRGARNESLEKLVVELSKGRAGQVPCWSSGKPPKTRRRLMPRKSPMREALEKAGLLPPEQPSAFPPEPLPDGRTPPGDLISSGREGSFEPEISAEQRSTLRAAIRNAAAKALSLGALRAKMDEALSDLSRSDPQRGETLMNAVHTAYQPPWQLALQRWMDAVAPAARSYAKASRRGAERDDGVVLCGRRREGWTLHIVLDTSGSMIEVLPKVLGLIASFCDGAGVSQAHVLQCDVEVTRDEWLEPAQLSEYQIAGFGGSDMSPALLRLADDPEVSSILILTDGYIEYPAAEPPASLLWAIIRSPTGYAGYFAPAYGDVVFVDP